METDFRLELAPDAALLATARLFAGAVARQAGCDDERVLDVMLAVSEACAPTAGAGGTGTISIEAGVRQGVLSYRVRTEGIVPNPDPDHGGFVLVNRLFEDAAREGGTGGSTVTFSLPVPDRGGDDPRPHDSGTQRG